MGNKNDKIIHTMANGKTWSINDINSEIGKFNDYLYSNSNNARNELHNSNIEKSVQNIKQIISLYVDILKKVKNNETLTDEDFDIDEQIEMLILYGESGLL